MNEDDARTRGATRPAVGAGANEATAAGGNALPLGYVLGDFEIESIIGEGGFSIVYLARDRQLGRRAALKEYIPGGLATRLPDFRITVRSERLRETFEAGLRSFVNEARILAHFDHPALVKVFRFWEERGTAYMAMPYYEGSTLKQALQGSRTAPAEAWLRSIFDPLFDAIELLHGENCFHRDIAPDNIMILRGGDPMLLDFGAARRVIGDMTQALTAILKPGYAPIEQYAETTSIRQGPWTDIYAIAAVLYWAVTGRVPSPSVGRLMNDDLRPVADVALPGYSDRFLAGIQAGLAIRPQDRPQSISEFRHLLGLRPAPAAVRSATAPDFQSDDTVRLPPAPARPSRPQTFTPKAGSAAPPRSDGTVPSAAHPPLWRYVSLGAVLVTALAGAWLLLRPSATHPPIQSAVPSDREPKGLVTHELAPVVNQPAPNVTDESTAVEKRAVAASNAAPKTTSEPERAGTTATDPPAKSRPASASDSIRLAAPMARKPARAPVATQTNPNPTEWIAAAHPSPAPHAPVTANTPPPQNAVPAAPPLASGADSIVKPQQPTAPDTRVAANPPPPQNAAPAAPPVASLAPAPPPAAPALRGWQPGSFPGYITSSLQPGETISGTISLWQGGAFEYLGSNGVRLRGMLNLSTPSNVTGSGTTYLPRLLGLFQSKYPDGATSARVTIRGRVVGGVLQGQFADRYETGQFAFNLTPRN
jgi:serine/threonine protein kinase